MPKSKAPSVWVVLESHNYYDQPDWNICAVFLTRPTADQLTLLSPRLSAALLHSLFVGGPCIDIYGSHYELKEAPLNTLLS
jgi:hypothetical protein